MLRSHRTTCTTGDQGNPGGWRVERTLPRHSEIKCSLWTSMKHVLLDTIDKGWWADLRTRSSISANAGAEKMVTKAWECKSGKWKTRHVDPTVSNRYAPP